MSIVTFIMQKKNGWIFCLLIYYDFVFQTQLHINQIQPIASPSIYLQSNTLSAYQIQSFAIQIHFL